jgi:flavin reductase (DIM6/NTAB) family NADH-FMN oxidoreductase RutF
MPVVVITARAGASVSCATTTCTYVSVRPPRLSFWIDESSRTCGLLGESGECSISFLSSEQAAVAEAAGRHVEGPDKPAVLGLSTRQAPNGLSTEGLANATHVAWCLVEHIHRFEGRALVIGRVVASQSTAGSQPLLRFGRRYSTVLDLEGVESGEYPI